MAMPDLCSVCDVEMAVTPKGNAKTHTLDQRDGYLPAKCKGSGKPPKPFEKGRCPQCHRVTTRMLQGEHAGKLGRHANLGGELCPMSMQEGLLVAELGAVRVTETPDSEPSIQSAAAPTSPPGNPTSSPESSTEKSSGPTQEEFFAGKPKTRATPRKRQALEGRAAEVSLWFDEMFFAYQHARPRSLQPTIGPSEAGSDCMRKIAMKLTQQPEVNFEKDSWPAWVGTQGHEGLEKMLAWANERFAVPRYLIEAEVEFGSQPMPRGHSDAFDRLNARVCDWKFPGKASISKMHLDGCPTGYRTQLHLYGLGMERAGETVREVCLVALPREGGTLADKYVFIEDYDREIALAALRRVESIDNRLSQIGRDWRQAPKTTSFLCNWCSYYLPNDKEETKGCSA